MNYIQYMQAPYSPIERLGESADEALLTVRDNFRKFPGVRQIYLLLDKDRDPNGTIEQHLEPGELIMENPETGEKVLVVAQTGEPTLVGGVAGAANTASTVEKIVTRGRPKGAMSAEAKAQFLAKRAATMAKNTKAKIDLLFIKPGQQLYITTANTLGGKTPKGAPPKLEYNTWDDMVEAARANKTKAATTTKKTIEEGRRADINNQAGHATAVRVSDLIAMNKQAAKESQALVMEGPTGTSISGQSYYGSLSMKPDIEIMEPDYIKKTAIKNGYQGFKYTSFDGAYQALRKALEKSFSGSEAAFNAVIEKAFPEILKLEKNGGTLNYLNYFN